MIATVWSKHVMKTELLMAQARLAVNENVVGGQVVYFPGAMGQSNFISPYHYQRQLLTRSTIWVCRGNVPPIAVHAPMCVQKLFCATKWKEVNRSFTQ